jgi:predicted nucleic acid-binding protein
MFSSVFTGRKVERFTGGFKITDCISFSIMERLKIHEAAATDHHFLQAGFAALLT